MATVEVRTQEELDAALTRGDYPVCVGGGTFALHDNASAVLRENASADLWDNASAVLRGNASAVLRENASADLSGNARAVLSGNASAVLWDNASAVLRGNASADLSGNARAVLSGNARAVLSGNASAVLRGNASADLSGNARAVLSGNASADLWDNARAVLWDNASAVLRGNASAVLRENASAVLSENARAVLRDNASADLWGNASADLWGNARVRARGHSFVRVHSLYAKVEASAQAMIALHCDNENITGGIVVRQTNPATAEAWCAHWGVEVKDGVAILFKGVLADFRSPHGTSYAPGTIPVAADWDGGIKECGGGLHFSPMPSMTHGFINDPAHYIACPVALADIAVHPYGEYPGKVKARGCCAPVWEVNEDGERAPASPI